MGFTFPGGFDPDAAPGPGGVPCVASVFFSTASDDVDSAARDVLLALVSHYQLLADVGIPTYLSVRGHADQRGKDDYNLRLSERRANSVAAFIRSRIIPGKTRVLIQTHGRGEAGAGADWTADRRADVFDHLQQVNQARIGKLRGSLRRAAGSALSSVEHGLPRVRAVVDEYKRRSDFGFATGNPSFGYFCLHDAMSLQVWFEQLGERYRELQEVLRDSDNAAFLRYTGKYRQDPAQSEVKILKELLNKVGAELWQARQYASQDTALIKALAETQLELSGMLADLEEDLAREAAQAAEPAPAAP